MITITIYTDEQGQERCSVFEVQDEKPIDVTADYEVAACQTEDGRTGLVVVRHEQ